MHQKKVWCRKGVSWLLSTALALTSISFSGFLSEEKASAESSYQLVWHDEFDGNGLDTSIWNCETGTGSNGWGNNELQYYTNRPENVSVSDGSLHITPRKEDYSGSRYTSGRITSYRNMEFTYGRAEARIKVPQVQGLWPAFWMLGADYERNIWPTCGEIDIMEAVNREGITYGTVHWGVNGANHAEYGQHTNVANMSDYHVYAVEWDQEYIRWFVDDVQYNVIDIKKAAAGDLEEFHHNFFLIFNVAVGGNWPGNTIDDGALPASMDVDYVRVYQMQDNAVSGAVGVPGHVTYRKAGDRSVISWDRVDGAARYNVYRASSRYAAYSLVDTVSGTEYTDNAKGYYYKVAAVNETGESAKSEAVSYELSLFGNNVYVFEQTDNMAAVQSAVDEVYSRQYTNQFGEERVALLFKPGTYQDVTANVGFYTQVEGLGYLPTDTVLSGLQVGADWMYSGDAGFNATCNFWRSAENMTIDNGACWAVAQATSLRRMKINGDLYVDFYGQGWASGGFMADCVTTSSTRAYSQQQWISRNCDMHSWSGGVWNAVLVGNKDDLMLDFNPGIRVTNSNWDVTSYPFITVAEKTPAVRETPYLYVENDEYYVYLPSVQTEKKGVSWINGNTPGRSVKLEEAFYVAKPEKDTSATLNEALAAGKSLLLTPGIYNLDQALQVTKANQSVIGLGYATLRPTGANACIETADVSGLTISGLLFDAGPAYSDTLLRVGTENSHRSHAANPTLLSDLFFRVGGVTNHVAQAKTCIVINSDDVIGDNFWVWRADHGAGVTWAGGNQTKNGVVVNGDYVNMYGLFVEHFHEYQTVWNGNYGSLYFYQSELPYDVPNQAAWKAGNTNGYASFKVADDVTDFRAYGMGIYSYNRDAEAHLESAMEVPDAPGVSVNDLCTVCLNGYAGIDHVINGVGGSVAGAGERQQILYYCNGNYSATNYVNGYAFSPAPYRNGIGTGLPEETDPESSEEESSVSESSEAESSASESSSEEESQGPSYGNPTVQVPLTGVYASTELQPAANAIDGNAGSRWESEIGVDPQWIYVDLGQRCNVTGVQVAWEAASAKTYQVQVSDDAQSWETVKTITDGASGETRWIPFETPKAGRYVRIFGTSRNLNYGYSIFEISVQAEVGESYFEGRNLALGQNTQTSSGNGSLAVDGNAGSRWESDFTDDEWIYVDLGQMYRLDEVKLIWEAAYASAYTIDVSSDGTNWRTVYTETAGDGETDAIALENVEGRYVRMNGDTRALPYGYSLWELQVYGGLLDQALQPSESESVTEESEIESESSVEESETESESVTEEPVSETESESSEEEAETIVTPVAVSGVQARYENGQIRLTWEDCGAVQYKVSRSDGRSGYTNLTYRASAAGYTDSNLVPAQLYYYRITGYFKDQDGNLVQGEISNVAVAVATDHVPAKVTGVAATTEGRQVTLTWDAAEGARYYKVSRAEGATGKYYTMKYNIEEPVYQDTSVSKETYRYKVVGYYKDVDGSWIYGDMCDTLYVTVK